MNPHSPPPQEDGRRRPPPRRHEPPPGLADALRREPEASDRFALILAHHRPRILGRARAALRDPHAAEDAAQVALWKAWTWHRRAGIDDFGAVTAYLDACLRSAIPRVGGEGRRHAVGFGADVAEVTGEQEERVVHRRPAGDAGEGYEAARALAALGEAMRHLDDRRREVLRACAGGMEQREVARRLGISPTRVSQLHRDGLARVQEWVVRHMSGAVCAEYAEDLPAFTAGALREERDLQVRLHVYGDPATPADPGCDVCRAAIRDTRTAARVLLPPHALLPLGGALGAVWGALGSAAGTVRGWLAKATGGVAPDPVSGGTVAAASAKGGVLTAAAGKVAIVATAGSLAVGGSVVAVREIPRALRRDATPAAVAAPVRQRTVASVAARPSAPIRTAATRARSAPARTTRPRPAVRRTTTTAPRRRASAPAPVPRPAPTPAPTPATTTPAASPPSPPSVQVDAPDPGGIGP